MNHPQLTAPAFLEQGTSAAAVLSISKFLADRDIGASRQMRDTAFKLARLTSVRLQALPRKKRTAAHKPAANDNRQPRRQRRAA